MKAKFVEVTWVRGVKKHRWECPNCRAVKNPECRFNLSPNKDEKNHNCKFCGTLLELRK